MCPLRKSVGRQHEPRYEDGLARSRLALIPGRAARGDRMSTNPWLALLIIGAVFLACEALVLLAHLIPGSPGEQRGQQVRGDFPAVEDRRPDSEQEHRRHQDVDQWSRETQALFGRFQALSHPELSHAKYVLPLFLLASSLALQKVIRERRQAFDKHSEFTRGV